MHAVGGLVVIVLSMMCWGGQVLTWLAPDAAIRWGFSEAEHDVEPAFWADVRAEALWDSLALWPMTVAGILLLVDQPAWPYFGLVGGGGYVYFAGRGIAARIVMRRSGLRIGSAHSVAIGLVALAVWGAMAAGVIVAAITALAGG